MVSPMTVMPAAMILLVLRCHTAVGTGVWCILGARPGGTSWGHVLGARPGGGAPDHDPGSGFLDDFLTSRAGCVVTGSGE